MRLLLGCFVGLLLSPALWASDAMPATPSAATADAERGRKLLIARHDTGCLLCHQAPGLKDGGEMGPSLKDVGTRLSPEQIRQRIADPRVLNPQSFMPSYFSTKDLHNVAKSMQGKTVLTEQGLEDIIAYLLKNPS
jgi:sulfur-oxidizing protein SoxX